jgi:hypothetical protein
MAGLAGYLHSFKRSVDHPMPGDRTLADLLASRKAPPLYDFGTDVQYEAAKKAVEELLTYTESLGAVPVCSKENEEAHRPFCGGPNPPVEIGSRAPM